VKTLKTQHNISQKLRKIKNRLDKAGVCWAIFAGAAAYCYGSTRTITDIDILVKSVDLEKAKAALKDVKGVDVVADLKITVNNKTCLFFMDEEMQQKIQKTTLFNIEIPLTPVEDNIILKAILQRTQKQNKHDIQDIKNMTANQKINKKYLKNRIKKYHAQKRTTPLLKRLQVL